MLGNIGCCEYSAYWPPPDILLFLIISNNEKPNRMSIVWHARIGDRNSKPNKAKIKNCLINFFLLLFKSKTRFLTRLRAAHDILAHLNLFFSSFLPASIFFRRYC